MVRAVEVGDRVWALPYPWFTLNVVVVAGSAGALVVDTHASARAAGEVVADVRRVLGRTPVLGVVDTHEHFDHCFGNATVSAAFGGVPVHAHEVAAARTVASGERIKDLYRAEPEDPHTDEVLATEVRPADTTFSRRTGIDLGDRTVELVHPGRGHTGGDALVLVPDADVVLAGDLVESAGPPGIGADAFLLEWPGTLDAVGALLGASTRVVPGHGPVVDRDFVSGQRDELARVVAEVRRLVAAGVAVDDALSAGRWPWPADHLANAVRVGYTHLGAA
jgi:glyoxylase-like metal-dependent hydrolase (beta-lactamase superfamily II)